MTNQELEKMLKYQKGQLTYISAVVGLIIQHLTHNQQAILFGARGLYPDTSVDEDELAGLSAAKEDLMRQFEHIPFSEEYLLPLIETILTSMPLGTSMIQTALRQRYLLYYETEPLNQILLNGVAIGRLKQLENGLFSRP